MNLRFGIMGALIMGVVIALSLRIPSETKVDLVKKDIGYPQRLVIPAIKVDTLIEQVGQDEEGRMAVPQDVYQAGWYKLGVKPGDKGNAVIDGHINTPELQPSIFFELESLKAGDIVMVEDDNDNTYTFKVFKVEEIPVDNFPIYEIFGPSDQSNLILITCSGIYDKYTDEYSSRVVVFARLIN